MDEIHESRRLDKCQRRGPGYLAKGCHGESRYAAVVSSADAVYVAINAIVVKRAWSVSDG